MHRTTPRIALVLVYAAACTGCSLFPDVWHAGVPVAYRSVAVVTGARGSLHEYAGLYYSLQNVSTKRIIRMEIAFELYDSADRPLPGPGANGFRLTLDSSIEPGATGSYCTSLDSVVSEQTDAITAARFRVRTAVFEDGSRWRNTGGHVYREEP